jgi:hypothetical protein
MMGPVSKFLVAYLDAIDERLLNYLDNEEELRTDTVERLRLYATALLDGLLTPTALDEDWPDWFDLAPAFVTIYAPEWMEDLEEEATFLDGPDDGEGGLLTKADLVYLAALESLLDMYPEMGSVEE